MENKDNKLISTMTARELKDYLFGADSQQQESPKKTAPAERRYLYSIRQLAAFLGVSYVTAWKMKETTLKDAVYQNGRVVIIDADKAMELMKGS